MIFDKQRLNLEKNKTKTLLYIFKSFFKPLYFSYNTEILLQNLQSGQSIDISKFTNPKKRPKL